MRNYWVLGKFRISTPSVFRGADPPNFDDVSFGSRMLARFEILHCHERMDTGQDRGGLLRTRKVGLGTKTKEGINLMRKLLAVFGALALSGCSTMMNGTTDTVNFDSEPRGAEVTGPNGAQCVTPCTMTIPSDSKQVTFDKDGYKPRTVNLNRSVSVGWGILGNCLLSYCVTAAVDLASGGFWYIENTGVNTKLGEGSKNIASDS
jgi:hypothetical protein